MASCPCVSCTREASSGKRRDCSPRMLRVRVLAGWDAYRHHFVLSRIITWENLVADQAQRGTAAAPLSALQPLTTFT